MALLASNLVQFAADWKELVKLYSVMFVRQSIVDKAIGFGVQETDSDVISSAVAEVVCLMSCAKFSNSRPNSSRVM